MKNSNLHPSYPRNKGRRKFRHRPARVLSDLNRKVLPHAPINNVVLDNPLQSDAGQSFTHARDYRALLRSSGHLFRDGRWSGDDDPFHVFREIENPGLGTRFTFSGGSYYRHFVVDAPSPLETYNWVPTVARAFVAEDSTSTYDTPLPTLEVPSYSDYVLTLNGLGTDFVRRFRPGNPVANLGEFIVELRDLPRLPRFLQAQAKRFVDLGSEYLNVEFGWKPFVRDLIKVQRLQATIEDRLRKLVQDNGIYIKRRSKHDFRTISGPAEIKGVLNRPFGELADPAIGGDPALSGFISMGPVPFGYFDPFMSGDCKYTAVTKHETESWFVGTYVYYVPDIGSDRWTRQAISELYGLQPHPEVIYRTYPWTWLSDWFFNVGDIVSNLTSNSVDSEAMGGGFVMHKDVLSYAITTDIQWDGYHHAEGSSFNEEAIIPPGASLCSYSNIRVNKLRQQASPFGFGLRPGDFTNRQAAILLALGISSKRNPTRHY